MIASSRLLRLAGLVVGLGAVPAAAGTVYVASQEAGLLTPVAPDAPAIAVGPGAAQVAAGPDGRLYLAHPDRRSVTVVDGRTRTVLARLPFDGQPFGLAVSADGLSLFVGDWSGNRVVRISAATGAVEGIAAVGRDPAGIVLDRRGRLYVADRESGQVSVVETAGMVRIATVAVGEGPFALALGATRDRLYVANVRSGDLSVIDTRTLRPVATVPVGAMPYGVAASRDGTRILVTNQQAATVTVLDAQGLRVVATVPVGRYPEGVVIEGGTAYVANWFSDSVSTIDLASLRETARIPVGEGPRSLAVGSSGAAAEDRP